MININLLPKTQRKKKGVDPLTILTYVLPIVALLVVGWLQFNSSQTQNGLKVENTAYKNEKAVFQTYIDEQEKLQNNIAELVQVQDTIGALQNAQITWSQQLSAMLGTLPKSGTDVASRITFTGLTLTALAVPTPSPEGTETATPAPVTPSRYDDLENPVAEFSVTGLAGSEQVIAEFIRRLQDAPNFGVQLQSVSKNTDNPFYTYNLMIGAASLKANQNSGAASGSSETASQPDAAEGSAP